MTLDTATSSVLATLSFNSFLLGIIMVSFELFRYHLIDIYAPRIRKDENSKIPSPSRIPLFWIFQVLKVSDETLLENIGLDGYIFLRYLKMCFNICLISCLGAIILIPIYATSSSDSDIIGIDTLSMANIENGDIRLWAPFVFIYLFTLLFLYFLYKEYENFIWAKSKSFRGKDLNDPLQKYFTVLVRKT